jgi:hypothetical protein
MRGVFVLGFLLIILILMAGCIQSHEKIEFDKARSLINTGESQLATLDFSEKNLATIDVGLIRANAAISKSNFTEALNILNAIPPSDLNQQDQADLQALKVLANIDIETSELYIGPISNFTDHFQNYDHADFLTFSPEMANLEVPKMKNDLKDIRNSLIIMNEELDSVNVSNLSPEPKGTFVNRTIKKSDITQIDDLIRKLEDPCFKKCEPGFVVGVEDCQCHEACGDHYCSSDAICCNDKCYERCPEGYYQNMFTSCMCSRTNSFPIDYF